MLLTGNTVCQQPFHCTEECIDQNIVRAGNKMLVGFGVGYSWGATIIEL